MGKNVTKKDKGRSKESRGTLRLGTMALLVLVGVGALAGLGLFNARVKPNRDMKWYIRSGSVEVAAPPVGEGYGGVPSTARRGSDILAGRRSSGEPKPTREPVQPGDALSGGSGEAVVPEETVVPGQMVTLTISAAGDCTFGGEVGSKGRRRFVDLASKNGNDYFLQNVRSVFEADDLTIVNLEGPLTTLEKTDRHGYVFKGDPAYAGILAGSSVELCNLANNHTLDYGAEGLKQTAEALDAFGVGYCGFTQAWNATIKGVRVTSLGFTKWDHDRGDIVRAVIAARESCDLLIVNMHWGWEGRTEQDSKQVNLGHAIIDAGADLVIGTHPHVYQGIEKYKGKYIVYSLGNFCFAGNANPSDKRCLIFQQTFSFTPGMGIAQANITDAGINIIPCTVSSVPDINDYQPTIMQAEAGAALLKAVASRSTNFSLEDTLWMPNNYMVTFGLVKPEAAEGEEAPAAEAEEAPAAEAAEAEEAPDDAAEAEEAPDDDAPVEIT